MSPTPESSSPESPDVVIDPSDYRRVLGFFPTGVTVIATHHEDRAVGLAVGSFFSVSLDPPLVGFCVGHQSTSWKVIEQSGWTSMPITCGGPPRAG